MKYEDVVVGENYCFENNNVITYHKKKKIKFSKTLILSVICFLSLFSLQFINSNFTRDLLQTFNAITQVGKPTAELFDEEGNVFFVSFFNSISLGNKVPKTFQVPIIYKSINCNGEMVEFVPANNIVSVGYDGQVRNITIENGKKIVYIEHSGGLVSRYENLEYVGVVTGQIVRQGMEIGSMKEGEKLTLSFTIKSKQATFKIENETIRFVI